MSIQESSNFDSEIYELKTTDKAVGGADGISNLQAKQLANRTQWLKQKIEELQGQSLQSLAIDEYGHLIVTLADGSTTDLGKVVGPSGVGMPSGGLVGQLPVKKSVNDFDFEWQDKPADGAPGLSVTSATINEAGHLILTLSDASTIDAGEVVEGILDAPSDGKQYARKNGDWDEVTGGGTSNPPKPIDLRGAASAPTLSANLDLSTIEPTIHGLTYSAVFDDTDQVCAVDIECEGGKGFWVAWKPTEANDTFVSIAPNIVGVGQFVMAYVEGTGLIAVADSSVIDPDFSVGDTLLLGIREDGQIFLGTDNVAVFDSPLSPTTVDSFMVGASSASATASFSCDVIVDKDLLPSSLKSVVTAEDLPAIYKLYPAWPPAEPVSVGDTFYVTHGGTFNGLTYSNPDANNNHEGFIVDELLPELKVTPFIKGSGGGSYLGDVTKSVGGGGDFADYDELQDWMDVNAGNIITVNVIGDVTTKADPLRAYNNKNWSFIKIKNTTSSYYKLPGGFGYVGCNFGVSIAGKFELQSAMQTINRAADGEAPYILELQGGFFYQQVHSDYVKTISDGILSAQDSVVISLETTKNVNLTNSRVLDYIKCLSDTASVALFGSNTIEKIDANDKTISTLIDLIGYSGTTQTSVGQIINDSNVTDIIESGKTINSFNNWGFVTVGNK